MKMKVNPKVSGMINKTIALEGGYVYHKDDKGSHTNLGITIFTAKKLKLDLNHDGIVNKDDVKLITHDIAFEIYANEYYFKPNIHKLPAIVQDTVFDMQVNSGYNAGKILQKLINYLNRGTEISPIAEDGIMGITTIAHCQELLKTNPKGFRDAYSIYRIVYYIELCRSDESQLSFINGWVNRANKFIRKENRFPLTDIAKYVS